MIRHRHKNNQEQTNTPHRTKAFFRCMYRICTGIKCFFSGFYKYTWNMSNMDLDRFVKFKWFKWGDILCSEHSLKELTHYSFFLDANGTTGRLDT